MATNLVTVKNVHFGARRPAIIVPLTESSADTILGAARQVAADTAAHAVDVVEWRIDHYDQHDDHSAISDLLAQLQEILAPRPILATFRTANEGGAAEISDDDYLALIQSVSASKHTDLVDVEFMRRSAPACIAAAAAHNVRVIGSNHDFQATPNQETIVSRLQAMAEMGCDIPKIAVTPLAPDDVLTLLRATIDATTQLDRPVITMSMHAAGMASRLSGGVFGSSATFATIGAASAPGQLPVQTVSAVLDAIHG